MAPAFYVLVIVTLVSGSPKSDEAKRMDSHLTFAECAGSAAWWNQHIANTKMRDQLPDTGGAYCINEPGDNSDVP